MVTVLPPYEVETPEPPPGKVWTQFPWNSKWLQDPEYYDALGRDPFASAGVWKIDDPAERMKKVEDVFSRFPKQMHRRELLSHAVMKGDIPIARYLIDQDVRVNPDFEKAEAEEADETEWDREANGVQEQEDLSLVPLHTAAFQGHSEIVNILLEKSHVDALDEIGRTPLMAAIQGAHPEIVAQLLELGADVNLRMNGGELAKQLQGDYAAANAIELIAAFGDQEMLQHMFERAVRATAQSSTMTAETPQLDTHETAQLVKPLAITTAAGKRFDSLLFLLEKGGYPQVVSGAQLPILTESQLKVIVDATRMAAIHGELSSLQLLLKYQYPSTSDGQLAPFEVSDDLAAWLRLGAYNASGDNRPEKFEFIHGLGAREEFKFSLGDLANDPQFNFQHVLYKAVESGAIESIKLFVEKYKADPNKHLPPNLTKPLYIAAVQNQSKALKHLLDNYKMHIHDGSGRFASGPTALWVAIWSKSLRSVEQLLLHGGPVDQVNQKLQHISEDTQALLIAEKAYRCPIRLMVEESEGAFLEQQRRHGGDENAKYIRLQVGPDDADWISRLEPRKSNDDLKENGEGARPFAAGEAAQHPTLQT